MQLHLQKNFLKRGKIGENIAASNDGHINQTALHLIKKNEQKKRNLSM